MMEIVAAAPLASVQDRGRLGHVRYGVGCAGAMDGVALAIGNALLGNDPDAAAIEIPLFPFAVRFHSDMDVAVTGADCDAAIDDRVLPPDWAVPVRAGQTLRLSSPRSGCRAYLCVGGGVDVPVVLGSRSTQLREGFGGHEGRTLRKGDRLRAGRTVCRLPDHGLGAVRPDVADPGHRSIPTVRVLPAAEYELFTADAHDAFWRHPWTVTPQSNRTGYRLAGPGLTLSTTVELRSHGIVPGVIQVPSGGQPIIQLADAATMGGYPKFGTVIEADLWKLGQVRPGEEIAFVQTDHAGAVAALGDLEAILADVAATCALQTRAARRWTR